MSKDAERQGDRKVREHQDHERCDISVVTKLPFEARRDKGNEHSAEKGHANCCDTEKGDARRDDPVQLGTLVN